jgi:hypothetical protein
LYSGITPDNHFLLCHRLAGKMAMATCHRRRSFNLDNYHESLQGRVRKLRLIRRTKSNQSIGRLSSASDSINPLCKSRRCFLLAVACSDSAAMRLKISSSYAATVSGEKRADSGRRRCRSMTCLQTLSTNVLRATCDALVFLYMSLAAPSIPYNRRRALHGLRSRLACPCPLSRASAKH